MLQSSFGCRARWASTDGDNDWGGSEERGWDGRSQGPNTGATAADRSSTICFHMLFPAARSCGSHPKSGTPRGTPRGPSMMHLSAL